MLAALCAHPASAQQTVQVGIVQVNPGGGAEAGIDWMHLGRGPDRVSVINLSNEPSPPPLGRAALIANQLPDTTPIEFLLQSSPVVLGKTAFALAFVDNFETLVAINLETAAARWAAPMPELISESWSSPAADAEHNTVVVAMGYELIALDADSGQELWHTDLVGPVVNASPVLTNDLGPCDRVFITDFGFYSDAGRLYCINTDPFDAAANPYQPGEIVWEKEVDAFTSGNTPAYDNATLYLATAGDGFGGGRVMAFDASATSEPDPLWVFDNIINTGFFGGVSVRAGAVYAASYGFNGGQLNSNIVKLSAQTGDMEWSAPSNRSSSIPVPLADGRVVLSGGIRPDPIFGDFGSRPSIAVYSPDGLLLLETALDTWTDSDLDGTIDPGEALLMGGWTHQPVVVESPSGHAEAICRALDVGGPGNEGLVRLNLDWAPGGGTNNLVVQLSAVGAGTPAAGGGWLLSIDDSGLTIRRPRFLKASP